MIVFLTDLHFKIFFPQQYDPDSYKRTYTSRHRFFSHCCTSNIGKTAYDYNVFVQTKNKKEEKIAKEKTKFQIVETLKERGA